MQTTTIDRLDKNFLERVDMLVRRGTKEMCGVPADTPIPVHYTVGKYRGLGMLRATWEASIHHRPKASARSRPTLASSSRFTSGRSTVSRTLRSRNRQKSTHKNRTELRCNEFNKWKELRQRGIGVLC